ARQEAYALRSHARALAAHRAGRLDAETVRLGAPRRALARDERARRLDPAVLARLAPAFSPDGTVTAATASPVSDGAAAVAVVPERVRRDLGAPGLRVLASATVGCDPALPGWGPVPAVRAVLARAGVALDDVAAVEVVEAFAAQVLAVAGALEPDPLGDAADDAHVCADRGSCARARPPGRSAWRPRPWAAGSASPRSWRWSGDRARGRGGPPPQRRPGGARARRRSPGSGRRRALGRRALRRRDRRRGDGVR